MNTDIAQQKVRIDKALRADFAQIIDWIPQDCRLLDVGCGDGALMRLLRDQKHAQVQGIELKANKVAQAIACGLSVVQGDANIDLTDYAHGHFDVVVLSQTLQTMHRPRVTLRQLGNIAPRVVVSTPNFAYWRGVMQLLWRGRMPMTKYLPTMWYDTDNIHMCTLSDFLDLVALENFRVIKGVCFDADMQPKPWPIESVLARLLAVQGLFLLEKTTL